MKTRALAAALMPAAVFGLAGCGSAKTMCTVRHHYAIVIFQNDIGNNRNRLITRFRLNVRYRRDYARGRLIYSRIVLKAATGGNPPIVVRTYHVGDALGCSINGILGRQQGR